jgi:hypothetical protein
LPLHAQTIGIEARICQLASCGSNHLFPHPIFYHEKNKSPNEERLHTFILNIGQLGYLASGEISVELEDESCTTTLSWQAGKDNDGISRYRNHDASRSICDDSKWTARLLMG